MLAERYLFIYGEAKLRRLHATILILDFAVSEVLHCRGEFKTFLIVASFWAQKFCTTCTCNYMYDGI